MKGISSTEFYANLRDANMCANCSFFNANIFSGKLFCNHPKTDAMFEIPSRSCYCSQWEQNANGSEDIIDELLEMED